MRATSSCFLPLMASLRSRHACLRSTSFISVSGVGRGTAANRTLGGAAEEEVVDATVEFAEGVVVDVAVADEVKADDKLIGSGCVTPPAISTARPAAAAPATEAIAVTAGPPGNRAADSAGDPAGIRFACVA